MAISDPQSPLTVSQLNRQVKFLLEHQYPAVPVSGELSNVARPASGHLYFTLKDGNAQVRCAMFRSSLERSSYRPKEGDQVIVRGRVSLYEGRGDYQIIVSSMQPDGEGALQQAFFQLKERLEKEGLFAPEHKQPLPEHIRTVGVVTSRTGAALHDILTVLKRRFPAMAVILYPVAVQGDEAPGQIVTAIETANRLNQVDALIVGRGGGSLEDLWSFNEEAVARAIFASRLPIVSAVGHEVDVSISDFVADVRAATPSQAAELISPDQNDIRRLLINQRARLARGLDQRLQADRRRLLHARQRLRDPGGLLREWQQRLDERAGRLLRALKASQHSRNQNFQTLTARLRRASPIAQLNSDRRRLEQLDKQLRRLAQQQLPPRRQQLGSLARRLNALSPLNTLERGYSITRDEHNTVVQRADDVSAGQRITTLLRSGKIVSRVEQIEAADKDD
ncbi:exodeoxyribonuclease VII large subunit [Saccharospirillum mangrovi]|uniref:exodeoxyribonuclease VII large subunit n=1 Tax=Saccharospirillum mangrovi TaxID=2161747 RepID=UPI000D3AAAAE|nr:exodeoxyribonuclease VII large subunit [Saccharospirillum mangrovi]